jgi:hypothetical protein
VKVVVKNFSIHGVNSDAPARAMIAAKIQDNAKAAKLVDMIMTREYRPTENIQDPKKLGAAIEKNVMKFAEEAGLNKTEADSLGDMKTKAKAEVDAKTTTALAEGEDKWSDARKACKNYF